MAPCASSPIRPTARRCWASSPPGWRGLRSTQWPTPAIARSDRSMPDLLIGPLLRYVSETEATIWVEASEQCEVEILGRSEPTFRVEDHHYALRSEEHTSELQSQSHISYAVFCLKKK